MHADGNIAQAAFCCHTTAGNAEHNKRAVHCSKQDHMEKVGGYGGGRGGVT